MKNKKKLNLRFFSQIFFYSTFIIFFYNSFARAQQFRPANSEKIYSEIAQLRNLVKVLYLAAHPDDENTRLISWLVNNRNISTAYLSLTRGDGGQNILGKEQGDALGLIRTHELIEARKIDGADQFFTRAIDFGFSKNANETFKHWNKDTLTYDVVWIMRKFRPDVVICRFPPDSMAGHGHHTVSAVIGAEAFKVAGRKDIFPDQIKCFTEWQPKRILFNAYKFGSTNTTSEEMYKLKVGNYEPLLGYSTGELAGISRSVHKSQGAGTASVPGLQNEYFKLVAGTPFSNSIFDGIDTTWNRVQRMDIDCEINDILAKYDFLNPQNSLLDLIKLRNIIESVSDSFWRQQKLNELDKIILDCAGIMAELFNSQPTATAGSDLPFVLHIISRANIPILLNSIKWDARSDTQLNMNIGADSLITFEHKIHIKDDIGTTQPYWLADLHEPGHFVVSNKKYLGLPETDNELYAQLKINISGKDFLLRIPFSYKKLDPVKGDIVEPIRIVPDATIDLNSSLLITNPDSSVDATVHFHAYREIKNAVLLVSGTTSLAYFQYNINLRAGADTTYPIHISAKNTNAQTDKDFYLAVKLQNEDEMLDNSLHLIQYNHLPTLQYLTKPYAKVLRPNWKCKAKKIAYIEGAGDNIPEILRLAGIDVEILKDNDLLTTSNLQRYDAIVTGIRAVNVNKKMAQWMPVLLKYVENGGTLVMQYNTLQDLATPVLGPYPITLSSLRVTEEEADVIYVDPESKLLNYPNKIAKDDFNGWIQERGLYFPTKWDERYKTLFSMHDTGEMPLAGSTLYANYGKGTYIYTSLSFSRQIPAGNTGAIRLFMNLLSAGK